MKALKKLPLAFLLCISLPIYGDERSLDGDCINGITPYDLVSNVHDIAYDISIEFEGCDNLFVHSATDTIYLIDKLKNKLKVASFQENGSYRKPKIEWVDKNNLIVTLYDYHKNQVVFFEQNSQVADVHTTYEIRDRTPKP